MRTQISAREMAEFIETATVDELVEHFKHHNVNDRDAVVADVGSGLTFEGGALQYAIFSDKVDSAKLQAIIDSGAELDSFEFQLFKELEEYDEYPDAITFHAFEDASAEKQEVLRNAVEAHAHWINRKYSDAEIYDLLTTGNVERYFSELKHDPNDEITWEYPEKNIRYTGPICGLAAFEDKVSGWTFEKLLQAGGDPNAQCRVESLDDTDNYDDLSVIELCHSVDKINRALDRGGIPTEHLLGDVLYGIKEDAAKVFFIHGFDSLMEISPEQRNEARQRHDIASENVKQLAPLELRLVTEHPDIFKAHHMHAMTNPQAVTEMLLMGHDHRALNDEGHNLMLGSLLNGKFETFEALRSFGAVAESEGQRPMDEVVKHFEEVQKHHVSGSGNFDAWRPCNRALDYLIDHSENPTADLASYMKIKTPNADLIVALIDRGAVMSDEAQRQYMSRGKGAVMYDELYKPEQEAVQDALNRQQRNVILAEVGEEAPVQKMRRKM